MIRCTGRVPERLDRAAPVVALAARVDRDADDRDEAEHAARLANAAGLSAGHSSSACDEPGAGERGADGRDREQVAGDEVILAGERGERRQQERGGEDARPGAARRRARAPRGERMTNSHSPAQRDDEHDRRQHREQRLGGGVVADEQLLGHLGDPGR